MKTFLTSVKGKIIAGAITGTTIVGVIAAVILTNLGYRTIAVEELNGTTQVINNSKTADAYVGQHLKSGDDVTVQTSSDLTLGLDNDKYVFAEENTHFWIEAAGKKENTRTTIHLDQGSAIHRIDNKLGENGSYEVVTPNSTMSVRGTVFRVTCYVDASGEFYTVIDVLEGSVFVRAVFEDGTNTEESRTLSAGDNAIIHSSKDFSEFLKGSGEIDYSTFTKKQALFLGKAIDEGRTLCITKELLYDLVEINEHQFGDNQVVVEATCTEEGHIYDECTVCGLQIEVETLPVVDHDYVVEEIKATCEEDGKKITKCRFCQTEKSSKVLKATGHSFGDYEVATEATCTEEGLLVAKCKNCTATQEQTTEALGHSFGKTVLIPASTAGEKGTWSHTCSRCGLKENLGKEEDSEDEEPKTVDCSNGHTFVTTTTSATCVSDGKTTKTCSVCGYSNEITIPATGHNYGAQVITTAATCTEKGVATKTCSNCKGTVTSSIAALGHNYGAKKTTKAATCTEKGEETQTCSRCKNAKTSSIAALGHNYGAAKTTKAPTCTEKGESTKTCSRCNDAKTSSIAATGHSYSAAQITKAATCTEKGETTKTCANCNNKVVDTIAATGHSYGDYVVTTAATCTKAGVETSTCSKCSDKQTKTIAATGHNYGDYVVTTAATCTAAGVETSTCSNCNDKQTKSIAATGHSYGDYVVTTAATCAATGVKTATCSKCSATTTQAIAKLTTHTVTEYIETTAATCTEAGEETGTCSVCNQSISRAIAALGHDWDEARPNEDGTHSLACIREECEEIVTEACSGGEWGARQEKGDGFVHTKSCSKCSFEYVSENCSSPTSTCEICEALGFHIE